MKPGIHETIWQEENVQDFEAFIQEQRSRAYWDLREGTTLDDDEIEREVNRQMNDLRDTYE